jgi:hypothetical protein
MTGQFTEETSMSTTQLETPTDVGMGGDGNGNDRDRLATLRRQFVVGEDVITRRMVACMEKIVEHCTIYENGNVDLKPHITGARNQIKTVLAARAVAARLDGDQFHENVTLAQLETCTGIARDVISARCGEMVKAREIELVDRAVWSFRSDKVERFLDTLPSAAK